MYIRCLSHRKWVLLSETLKLIIFNVFIMDDSAGDYRGRIMCYNFMRNRCIFSKKKKKNSTLRDRKKRFNVSVLGLKAKLK